MMLQPQAGNPSKVPGAPPLGIGGAPHPYPYPIYEYNENLHNDIWDGLYKEYTIYALQDTLRHPGYDMYLGDADSAILAHQQQAYLTPSNIKTS